MMRLAIFIVLRVLYVMLLLLLLTKELGILQTQHQEKCVLEKKTRQGRRRRRREGKKIEFRTCRRKGKKAVAMVLLV
jgi:hypothetical protein